MSKRNLLKKTLAVSTAVVLSTALLNFGPVSYKVFDNSAVVVHAAEVDEVKSLAQAVLDAIYEDEQLKTAYEEAIAEAKTAASNVDISGISINLASKVDDPAAVKVAVKVVMSEVFAFSGNTDISTIPSSLSIAVSNLNSELGTTITASDVASFLLLAQEKAINIDPITLLSGNVNIVSVLIDASKEVMEEEWTAGTNEVVKQLKALYNDNLDEVKSDLSLLKTAILAKANQAVLEKGGMALALSYVKHELNNNSNAIIATQEGNLYTITALKVGGIEVPVSLLASQLKWSATEGKGALNIVDGKVVLDVTGIARPVEATVTGTFTGFEFEDITLVSKQVTFLAAGGGGGGGFGGGAIVDAINPPDTTSIEVPSLEQPLSNNSEQQAFLANVNKQLAERFTFNLSEISNTVGQLTIVDLMLSHFSEDFYKTLETIVTNAKEQVEAAGATAQIKPVITYKLDTNNDGVIHINNSVLNKLDEAGLYSIKLATNEASFEVPLAGLGNNASISLKSEPADTNLSNTRSNVYTIDVKENGRVLPHSEQQYKVSIPVADGADISKLTVAKVEDGSITYIGGKYDAETKTIVFYSNEPGSFVAVEHDVSFADAGRYDWAEAAIKQGAVHGILLGKSNNEFKPEDSITRAEFVAVLTRALNLTASETNLTFADVPTSAWHHAYVAAAVQFGITNGRSASQFDPNATITREEMASLAANAMKNVLDFGAGFETSNPFTEDGATISEVHKSNVNFLANEGIMQGTGEGQFDPKKDVSRAEAIVTALRLLEKR